MGCRKGNKGLYGGWFGFVVAGIRVGAYAALALPFVLRRWVGSLGDIAGIRVMTYPFTRRPCAGRHLLSLPPQRK